MRCFDPRKKKFIENKAIHSVGFIMPGRTSRMSICRFGQMMFTSSSLQPISLHMMDINSLVTTEISIPPLMRYGASHAFASDIHSTPPSIVLMRYNADNLYGSDTFVARYDLSQKSWMNGRKPYAFRFGKLGYKPISVTLVICGGSLFITGGTIYVNQYRSQKTCVNNDACFSVLLDDKALFMTHSNMNVPRSGHSAVAVDDHRFVVVGGDISQEHWDYQNVDNTYELPTNESTAEIYDIRTRKWTILTGFSSAAKLFRSSSSIHVQSDLA